MGDLKKVQKWEVLGQQGVKSSMKECPTHAPPTINPLVLLWV